MRGIPGLVDIKSSTEGGNPELQIRFDRERLATLGLQRPATWPRVVRSKVLGDVATDITREDRTIDIRLRAEEQFRDSVEDLREPDRRASRARRRSRCRPWPTVTETEGPAEIRRADGERVALITANLVGPRPGLGLRGDREQPRTR